MAGRTRLFMAVVLAALIAVSCSSGGDDEVAELESVETSTTSTTEATTTTSTIATTTTLSEQAQAEADVAQLVTDFWLTEIDSSVGEFGLEYTTGLVTERITAAAESLETSGQILRQTGEQRIEIISAEVDLETRTGEVKACRGSSAEIIDAETLERIGDAADPGYLTTSVYFIEEVSDEWRISEIFASSQTDTPELCEIGL